MKKVQTGLYAFTIGLCILTAGPISDVAFAQTCNEWAAKVVSVQGVVHIRRAGESGWIVTDLNDVYCSGDMVRVEENSRAAVLLPNEAVLRIDQKTTLTFTHIEEKQTSFINLLKGVVHFFSRKDRGLKVATPFVNGTVQGTEFLVKVEDSRTLFVVFEGKVAVANDLGNLILPGGQSAEARAGQAPAFYTAARPKEAVQWALYYPPVIDYRPENFSGGAEADWQEMVQKSLRLYWEGDLAGAFSSLTGVPDNIRDVRFFNYRAALLLTVGRVEEARNDIRKALSIDPSNSQAFALQAIIAVVQNEKELAINLARNAVASDRQSSAARAALSYVRQAMFDVPGALDCLKEAVALDPANPLAWARLAELWQAAGYLDRSLEAAQKAVSLNPNLERGQTVLGFAYLTQIRIKDSIAVFEKAISLDSAAPLPRLGLGLAKIRDGDLKEGRLDIEIAAGLDPNNSLIRSYLGKAYYEEKRDELAADQLSAAKKLDSKDPTPWFYDAIRKQGANRPVEALRDLQKSIELNDNRAVYRSRLLLDEDLAARSASLGRIYQDLGFEQLALVEGWKSVNTDPANYSAHRFLADSYAALPRHEIARVSELLQSQLLQPININPVQPSLAESNLFILEGAGPSDPSFNEFNPLFNRNRLALQAGGVLGSNDTRGGEVVQSGVWDKVSYSVGGFKYNTDGFRENNDLEKDIFNAFVQTSLTHKTSVQAEYRYKETENGDLPLRFDPDDFTPTLRQDGIVRNARLGIRHALKPHSNIIGSLMYGNAELDSGFSEFFIYDLKEKEKGLIAEIQHLYRPKGVNIISGVGYFDGRFEDDETIDFLPFFFSNTTRDIDIHHTNLYLYSITSYPQNFVWTLGASGDFFEGGIVDRDQFNPKLGVSWSPIPSATVRAGLFRTLKRTLISSQTIEPTQVAGFNQFFDDPIGTDAWRYGIAVDQKFSKTAYAGVEYTIRDLEVPFEKVAPPAPNEILKADWEEKLVRTYVYWTPHHMLSVSGEFQYERLERDEAYVGPEKFAVLKTFRFPLGVSVFHPSGLSGRLKMTYVDQEGEFGDPLGGVVVPGGDNFWVLDAFMGYRLPKRYGILSMGVRNLFDKEFRFQDTDPANPTIQPVRSVFAKVTIAY